MFSSASLDEALHLLGEVLAARKQRYVLVAIGGGSLLLLRLVTRPTKDLDIVARVEAGDYVSADPLPEPLLKAIEDIAIALRLSPDWVNSGPAMLLSAGLPPGFVSRLQTQTYGKGLSLLIAGRFDQICLKLFAAVDQGPTSKHFADLRALEPTAEEIDEAFEWVKGQDASEAFAKELLQAVANLRGVHDA